MTSPLPTQPWQQAGARLGPALLPGHMTGGQSEDAPGEVQIGH